MVLESSQQELFYSCSTLWHLVFEHNPAKRLHKIPVIIILCALNIARVIGI